MEHMSVDSEAVIEFGAPERPEREERPSRFAPLRDLGSDHRLPVLVAGIGAAAAFASLISEWQTTTVQGIAFSDGEVAEAEMFRANVIDLGGAGAAYLGGLFLVVTAVVLALFGPTPARRYARLAGFSLGGVQLALMLAVVQMLGENSLLISRFLSAQIGEREPEVAYGRGIWCALAGAVAALIALWLAERQEGEPRERRVKPRPAEEPENIPDAPLELSIAPAAPFAHLQGDQFPGSQLPGSQFPGDRDRPHRA